MATRQHPLLAAVIVLDQFSRNLFRDTSGAYAADPVARRLPAAAIAQGFDVAMTAQERLFLYLPFEHSEDRVDQALAVELIAQLGNAGVDALCRGAQGDHRSIRPLSAPERHSQPAFVGGELGLLQGPNGRTGIDSSPLAQSFERVQLFPARPSLHTRGVLLQRRPLGRRPRHVARPAHQHDQHQIRRRELRTQ